MFFTPAEQLAWSALKWWRAREELEKFWLFQWLSKWLLIKTFQSSLPAFYCTELSRQGPSPLHTEGMQHCNDLVSVKTSSAHRVNNVTQLIPLSGSDLLYFSIWILYINQLEQLNQTGDRLQTTARGFLLWSQKNNNLSWMLHRHYAVSILY